jgi:hypothetical protein
MDRLVELRQVLTSEDEAQQRADMPLNRWTALLREYMNLREFDMLKQLKKARTGKNKFTGQLRELERELEAKELELLVKNDTLAVSVLEGGDLAKLTKELSATERERDALVLAVAEAKRQGQECDALVDALEREEALERGQALYDDMRGVLKEVTSDLEQLDAKRERLGALVNEATATVAPYPDNGMTPHYVDANIMRQAAGFLEDTARRWAALVKHLEQRDAKFTR